MVVQHNLTAMNSNRMLGLTTASQAKSTEKLSSGYKINRAADDAAGLSISEKMRRQIRGLTQASLNAQDGISAVQTAEGALTEVHDMLQRMDELATKAANGTLTQEDRKAVQDEIDQLVTEIDRVSETTTFNEMALLKGDGTETKTVQTEAVEAVAVQAEYAAGKGTDSGIAYAKDKDFAALNKGTDWYAAGSTTALTADEALDYFEVKADGTIALKANAELYKKAADDASEFGAQTQDQRVAAADVDLTALSAISTKLATDDTGATKIKNEELKDYFNTDGSLNTDVYAQKSDGTWAKVGAEQIGDFVKVTEGKEAVAAGEEEVTVAKALEFNLHVGAESDAQNKISVKIDSMSAASIGVDVLKETGVMTEDAATAAIDTIKAAISKVSEQRSTLGAAQNRLEHTINNLDNVVENTTSAESQIRDTDMATEMVKYSNNNILAQAGQAMLAQSNQVNQGVLSLLQ